MTIKKLYFTFLILVLFIPQSFAQTIDFNELKQCYAALKVYTPDQQVLKSIPTSTFLDSNVVGNTTVHTNALIVQKSDPKDPNQLNIFVIQEGQPQSFPANLFRSKAPYNSQAYRISRSSVAGSSCNPTQTSVNLPINGQCPNRTGCPQVSMQLASENKTVSGKSVSSLCPAKLVNPSTNIKPVKTIDDTEVEKIAKQALVENIQFVYDNYELILEQLRKKSPPSTPDAYEIAFKTQALRNLKSIDPRGSCQKIFSENNDLYPIAQKLICEKLEPTSVDCQNYNINTNTDSGTQNESSN